MNEKRVRAIGASVVLLSVAVATGCGGIIAGRNVRQGRDEFAEHENCPKEEVKAKNEGKITPDDAPNNLMGANKVSVTGCGTTKEYVCATFDTGGGGSSVECKAFK